LDWLGASEQWAVMSIGRFEPSVGERHCFGS
jgi:hypothetical protein